MLRVHEAVPKAKAVSTQVAVYDGQNRLVRMVADVKMDGFADSIDLPDGAEAFNINMIPIRLPGVEAYWSEGNGETIFIWDARSELGEPVKQGVYRIDIRQADSFGRTSLVSAPVSVKAKEAA